MQRGFTLIEMMVALAMTALIMTLLLGTSYYVMQVREKLGQEIRDGEALQRRQLWFRQIIGGVIPLKPISEERFEGDENGFKALSAGALSTRRAGIPQQIELRSEQLDSGEAVLRYRAGTQTLDLASWPDAQIRFTYYDFMGNKRQQWRGEELKDEFAPSAIEIRVLDRGNEHVVLDRWFARNNTAPWVDETKRPGILFGNN